MTEDEITWHFRERSKRVYIKKKYTFGKYTFHSYEYFDEKKFRDDEQKTRKEGKILFPPELSVLISWTLPSNDASKLRNESKEEVNQLLNIITLQTNSAFNLGPFDHNPGDKSMSSQHNEMMMQPPYQELMEGTIGKAIELKNKVDLMTSERKELMIRTIDWYSRGVKEYDLINSFANFWIGFESLSYWLGKGPSFKCPECGHQIHSSSIRGRIREFLKSTGLSNEEKTALKLYEIRNDLFHNAKNFDPQMRINLRELLKKCIFACLS